MRTLLLLLGFMMLGTLTSAQPGSFPGKFVHSVYFWLNNPDSEEDRRVFLANLHEFLENSKYLSSWHVAPPAGTPREVVDNSYHYNLVVTFDSKALQDLYQTEEAHLKFIDSSNHLWDRVQIYDSFREDDGGSPYRRGDIQVGVVVSDLERSIKFYTEILGMEKTGGFSVDGSMAGRAGLTNGVPLEVAVLKLRNEAHASEWKLMEFQDAPDPAKSMYINEGSGMRYVTFYVRDMKGILERLRENDIQLLGETPIALGEDQSFILVQDPDGIFVELIGPKL